jgi:hypothetical protein
LILAVKRNTARVTRADLANISYYNVAENEKNKGSRHAGTGQYH